MDPVDWGSVDQELARVSEDLKNPEFEPFPVVVEVLCEENPELRLKELKEQYGRLELLVDSVVHAYHNGFNKALQNYSGILQHFNVAQSQVESLRCDLDDARSRLGAKSRHLEAQWQKSIMLADTLQLMDDVQAAAELPDRICELEKHKEWEEAVGLLLQGAGKLARQELRQVEGLINVRKEMAERRRSLQEAIVAELQRQVYSRARESSDSSIDAEDAQREGEQNQQMADPLHRRLSSLEIGTAGASLSRRNSSMAVGRTPQAGRAAGRLGGSERGAAALRGMQSEMELTGHSHRANSLRRKNSFLGTDMGLFGSQRHKRTGSEARGVAKTHRNTLSSMDLFNDWAGGADEGGESKKFDSLVRCLVQIGGVADAKCSLQESISSQTQSLIREAVEATRPESNRKSDLGGNTILQNDYVRVGLSPDKQRFIASAVQAVFEGCSAAFRDLVTLLRNIAEQTEKEDPAIPYVKQFQEGRSRKEERRESEAGNLTVQRSLFSLGMLSAEDSAREARKTAVMEDSENAWTVMMNECEHFLQDLLIPMGKDSTKEATGKWNSGPANSDSSCRLAFQFDVILDDFKPDAFVANRANDLSQAEIVNPDYRTTLKATLGHEPSPYHAVPLYRPVVQFVDAGNRILDSLARELSTARQQSKQDATRLRHFLEGVVIDSFLPRARVDFRARCSTIVEDPEMFRPRARFRASYEKEVGKGRPVLGAALAAESLFNEVMGWAANMPLFSQQLASVADATMGRLLGSLSDLYADIAGERCKSAALASRADIALKMASEPAAGLLQEAVKFYCPKKENEFDSRAAVAAIAAAGLGSSGDGSAAGAELLQILQKELPVAQEDLLMDARGDMGRISQIAAVSDSLEYLSQVIHDQGTATIAGNGKGGKGNINSSSFGNSRHNRRNGTPGGTPVLSGTLKVLVDRCQSLSGRCLRTLRLELQLLLLYYLQDLPNDNFLNDDTEAVKADERLGGLTRSVSRFEDAVGPFLPSRHRSCVLCSERPAWDR